MAMIAATAWPPFRFRSAPQPHRTTAGRAPAYTSANSRMIAAGTPEAAARLQRVLTADPGIGVARHVDAGYELAVETARRAGLRIPMLDE